MKDIINLIKKLWSNQNSKTLIFFGFYAIFFTFALIISSTIEKPDLMSYEEKYNDDNEQEEIKEQEEKSFYTLNEYSFAVVIDSERIYGYYLNSNMVLTYKSIDYQYSKGTITPTDFPYTEILPYLDNKFIDSLIKDEQYFSKTEFNDGSTKIEYHLDNIILLITETENVDQIDINLNGNVYNVYYSYE